MERYYPPFLAAIRAGARSVMAAYNSVDGSPATQNRHLLTDVLKRDWAFQGIRDLRRVGHERRHRAAHDGGEHGDGGAATRSTPASTSSFSRRTASSGRTSTRFSAG